MNENRKPVPAGVYDCILVSASRSNKKGHEHHFILSLRLCPQGCGVETPCEYFAELPLVFAVGVEFGFYDRENNCNVRRKATTADTMAAIEYAKKCIPEWASYIEQLPGDAPIASAFEWFNSIPNGVIVRANVKVPREYNGKLYYEANIYERGGSMAVASDFTAVFGKSLKAAGFKVGGGSKSPSSPTAKFSPKPPAPKGKAPAKVYSYDDAREAYEANCIIDDPSGANFWPRIEAAVGKPAANYKSFTSADWQKCVEEFSGLPF